MEISFKRLKSDLCFCISSEGDVFVILTPYVNGFLLLEKYLKVLGRIKQKLMSCFSLKYMRNVSLVVGTGVTRDRTKRAGSITHDNHTKPRLELYGMADCNPAYTPGVGIELSLDRPEETLLNKGDKKRFQAFTGSVMYPGQLAH